MRSFSSLCLPCRHLVLSRNRNFLARALNNVPSRASSLTAIHRGLRDCTKARPQGFDRSSLATSRPPRLTSRQRQDPGWTPPDFTIKKGKKNITDQGPQPLSRRKRFNDPTETFGKRSLVYRMKHGDLKDRAARLGPRDAPVSSPTRRSSGRLSPSDFMQDFQASSARPRSIDSEKNGKQQNSTFARSVAQRDRASRVRPSASSNQPYIERGQRDDSLAFAERRPAGSGRPMRTRPDTFPPRIEQNRVANDRPSRYRFDNVTAQAGELAHQGERQIEYNDTRDSPPRSSFRDDGPIRIHHTTAASQFLYGRSVVEAALKDSKRQLYRLYIYGGEDRRNVSQDVALEKLASRRGISVTKVERSGQRMMDKMSAGRPHNGCVLEASPLPQLPLKALGGLSGDAAKPGFTIDLAHQSDEEAKVNGTSSFVNYQLPPGRNPFVLLLDGILDPGNLGAILRTAAFMGVNAIAITNHSSATITSVALKASAGAAEVMTLFSVSSTLDFLARSKEAGWMVYAAVPGAKRSRGNSHVTLDRVESYDPLSTQPTILVIGSEGEGLTKQVRRQADYEVSIPSHSGFLGVVDSLNVSVATGVLCSAFLKKQSSGILDIEDDLAEDKDDDDEAQLW
ncbi:RNA methyltransferase [Xylariaceae sp. FL0016]|nr:RNA methyltransferase [Xylariaceae sp. FL0016]